MCQFQSWPSAHGDVIASLKRGDEIIITKGFGYPPAEEDVTTIVVDVQGASALANNGTRLMCHDGAGITPTGNYFADFIVSPEAQAVIDEVAARRRAQE